MRKLIRSINLVFFSFFFFLSLFCPLRGLQWKSYPEPRFPDNDSADRRARPFVDHRSTVSLELHIPIWNFRTFFFHFIVRMA